MRKALFLLCVGSISFLQVSFGAGFSIFEQGAGPMAMAGAFTARADDPSAIFFNPAGITQLDGTQISVGITLIKPSSTLTDPYGREWDSDNQTFYPPNLYITHQLNDRFSLGLGFGAPYGLGMKWDNNKNFIYRYLVEEVNVASYYFNPVFAYDINDHFSIGGGLTYVLSDVDYAAAVDMTQLSQALSASLGMEIVLPDGHMKLEGDSGSGEIGFNIGIQAKFEPVRLGFVYRSEVDCSYEGNAKFNVTPTGYGAQIDTIVDGYFPDTKGETDITMPASASFGVAYDFTENFSMEFDVNWMGWSSYESLDLAFENEGIPDKSQNKDWDDVFSYRLGARYLPTEKIRLFAGYYFDESPVPDNTLDPILPGADRHSFQIGAGYDFGNIVIEGAYQALMFDDRETTTNYLGIDGKYESFSNLFGIQLTYKI
ncbi:TonB-dependent receptor [bacterium]|nr:TonB-dependent receptor [candidate division CSSED10-310 bacterium]